MSDRSADKIKPQIGASRERKGGIAAQIRETRERLTSKSGTKPAFDRELLLTCAKNQNSVAIIVPLLAIIIAAITTVWAPWPQTAMWLSAVLLGNGILTAICQRFDKCDVQKANPAVWQRRFIMAEGFNGIMWATIALIATPATDQAPHIFMFAVMIVILAMRTVTVSNLPIASLAGTLPITAAIILRFTTLGEVLYFAMAVIAAGAQVFFFILARQFHLTVLAMLGFRAEKDALIAELEQAKAVSDEARHRAEEANLAKSKFLATMSHELRTPLNAILGFSEVLKDEILGKHGIQAYRDYSIDIHRSGEHLLNLINEILDLSRIEAGRYEIKESAVSLPAVAEDCRYLLSLRAKERGITIIEHAEENLPKVWADERALRQLTLNLLSNAIKFTPNGGEVTVTIGWTAGGGQYLSVRDNGPGIPEEELPTILNTFGRGSLAQKNAEEGSGLGLPIVAKLAELHGGSFNLKSKLREGTNAIFALPRERVMKALPPLEPEDEQRRTDKAA